MAATIERLKTYIQEHQQGQNVCKTAVEVSDSDEQEDEGMYEQDLGAKF